MKLIEINLCGSGCYSGASYNETIFLLEEDYLKLNADLNGEEIYLGELDGKHSEVFGEVYVSEIENDDLENYNFDIKNDGDDLYYYMKEIDKNVDEYIHRSQEFIYSIDSMVVVSFKVKKSQVELVENTINKLI